jgi:hypothetical protein
VQDTRPGPVSFLVNAPKSEVYGAELEASARLSRMFKLNASAGYLHARYKQLTLQGTKLDGNNLPFAPEWTFQAGIDATLMDNATGKLTLSPPSPISPVFSPFNAINATGTTQNNAELQQGAYAKVNVSAAFQTGRFTFKAFANNLFDRQTYAYGLDLRGAGFLQLPRAFHAAHVRRSVGRVLMSEARAIASSPIDLKDARLFEQGVPWEAFARLRHEEPVYWNPKATVRASGRCCAMPTSWRYRATPPCSPAPTKTEATAFSTRTRLG